jgi:trans-aconitate methyltransferase
VTANCFSTLRAAFPSVSEFHGADLSPETTRGNAVRHPWAQFSVLNLEQAALPQTFDAVICSEVIEHLDDRTAGMRHLAAMVAPNGHLVVTCPTGKVHETERRFGHVAHPTPEELRRSLTDAGLEVVTLSNWGFPLYTAMKYATNMRTDWAVETFASGAYSLRAKLACHALYWLNFANASQSSLGCQLFALARRNP